MKALLSMLERTMQQELLRILAELSMIKQFELHNIEYELKNEKTGHFHCRRKSDDKLFQFYAGTGKIMGEQNRRGIHTLIKILTND